MMESIEFICLGSGSSGNCYLFKKNNECFIVECGLEYKEIINGLLNNDISLSNVVGVIVSHQHADHSRSVKSFISAGIKTYLPLKATEPKMSELPNVFFLYENAKYDICSWLKVSVFKTLHDCDSYGFAFKDKETNESTLFITDTKIFDFPYKKYSFDYIFIECNHIKGQLEALMQTAMNNGKNGEALKYKRQSSYHLSLLACKNFLNVMNLKKTKCIFLIHLSQDVCDDVVVKTEINKTFNIRTVVCKRNGGIN